jgi:hypothetical protein
MAERLFVYAISPMDWGWGTLPTVEEYLKTTIEEHRRLLGGVAEPIGEIENFVDAALTAGREHGWEGDFRSGNEPRVVVLPDENDPKLALVWKQDNNGATFVASQVALPWLDQ